MITGLRANRHWLLLAMILILGAALRLYDPGLSEFKYDEARSWVLAKDIAQGKLHLAGETTSLGIPNTPLVSWLLAFPAAFRPHDPTAGVAFWALLDVFSVLLTYVLGTRYFGARVGLVAALLYASDPWAIVFSRKIWHNILPLTTALLLLTTLLGVVEKRPWVLATGLLALGIQIQTHLRGLLYLPGLLGAALLTRFKVPRRAWAVGLIGLLLVSLPYISYLIVNRVDVPSAIIAPSGAFWLVPDLEALRLSLWTLSGENLEAVLVPAAGKLAPFSEALPLATLILATLLVFGVARSILGIAQREHYWDADALVIILLGTTLLPLVFHPFPIYMQYFILLFPMVFLVAAIGWEMAFDHRHVLLRGGGVILLVLVAGLQVATMWRFYSIIDGENTAGGFGVPMKDWVALAKSVRQEAEVLGTREVAVITEGTDPLYEEWPSRFSALLEPDLDLRFLGRGGTQALLFRQDEALLYLVTREEPILEETLLTWGKQRQVETLVDGTVVRLVYFPAQTGAELKEALDLVPVEARFQNGAELVGYRVLDAIEPGATWRIQVLWHFGSLDEANKDRDWQVFNHFVDAQGKMWAQADGFGLASAKWREGDWLLQWVELALPPDLPEGSYYLQAGMYSLRDGARSLLSDATGTLFADAVRLGPFPSASLITEGKNNALSYSLTRAF